ncbi:MAG: glutamine amidotransferase [Gemmataceae bacterium]
MEHETTITLTSDPAWPWSQPHGLWILAGVGVLLAVLTVWTYRGQQRAGARRVAVILGLRLFALFLACLTILRPSLAFRDDSQTPSVLLVVLDASASMTIQDEHDNQSRWEAMQRLMKSSEPLFKELENERNVSLIVYRFAGDAQGWDENALPDGQRTDIGRALHSLYELHRQEKNLRGLILVSDGADNGNSINTKPLAEAARWRNLPCPVYTFALGKVSTADAQNDIVIRSLIADPSPVPVKGKLNIKATVDAFGFNDAEVDVHLLVDSGNGDEEVLAQKERLTQPQGNVIQLSTDAPSKPGEIKVTLRIDPKPGEVSNANNEVSTYVSVTKEGISVLLVDKLRFPEPQFIVDAISADPRIRVYPAWLRTDKPGINQVDLFQFDKQRYDVIILGDVSVQRMLAASPNALQEIHDLVAEKGTGLLMMGGSQALGLGGWNAANVVRTEKDKTKQPILFANMLPVDLTNPGEIKESVRMEPTADGLVHFVMKLADSKEANAELWRRLPPLKGMTRLGKKKDAMGTVTELASWPGRDEPVLVGQRYGEGRVLVFGGDTTYLWRNLGWPEPKEGIAAHARFWRQLVYWLAQQDKLEGSVWIKPDIRRVAVGDSVPFSVGARGKGGVDLDTTGGKASFAVEVIGPNEKNMGAVTVAPDIEGKIRGVYYPTVPGEHRFKVKGKATDTDGSPVTGEATVRFLVYQDESELARRSADHQFLQQLAHAGGGSAHLAQELPDFLRKLKKEPLLQSLPRVDLLPDWRSQELSPFMVILLLVFTAVLCLEWFFRRRWGLV